MEKDTCIKLAASLPGPCGCVLTPAAHWIEQAQNGSWTAEVFWPGGDSSQRRAFPTATAARDWALSQTYYRPTLEQVTHNGRFGCD